MVRLAHDRAAGATTRVVVGAALVLAVGALLSFAPRAGAAPQDPASSRLSRSMTPQILQEYQSRGPAVAPEKMSRSHPPGGQMTPPANPQLGDSWIWYLWYFAGGPPHYILASCTIRGVGQNVYVVVQDTQWGTRVDQADVDAIVAAWDNHSYGEWPNQGFYQLNTEAFGPAPDLLDDDPKIYCMLYDFDTPLVDGFFWVYDEYYDGWDPTYRSNECEVIYVDASTADPGGPGGAYLTSVMCHEFQHMITWYADGDEEAWIEEGMSEFAMYRYGTPDPISAFNDNPDRNLTFWPQSPAYIDYVKAYLWMLYLYEHFGGLPILQEIVSQPANGVTGVRQALLALGYATTFEEAVRNWVTANYLDNPTIEGGLYNYAAVALPPFASITKSSYPVAPTSTTVNRWAADYVKFTNGQPQRLNFDGADAGIFYVRLIKYLAGAPLSVEDMTLDPLTRVGTFDLFGFGTAYDQVVMIVNCVSPGASGTLSYVYSTESIPSGVEEAGAPVASLRLSGAGPNPFREETALRLSLAQPGPVSVTVHDAAGALVRMLEAGSIGGTERLIRWDGRDGSGQPVPAGAYFVRAGTAHGDAVSRRLTVLR